MKRPVALPMLLLVVSCGDDKPGFWDDRPVDGQYRVTIEQSKNTCNDAAFDPQATSIIDMFLRPDGLYDLRHGNFWVPIPFTVSGLPRPGGNVDYGEKWKSGGDEYSYSIKGTVTPDAMDLDVVYRGTDDCVQKLRLYGAPRPLLDPTALDGDYTLSRTDLGLVCSDEAGTPGTSWKTVNGIYSPRPDLVIFRLSDGTSFMPTPPDEQGLVEWYGTYYFPMGFFTLELQSWLKGKYGPDDVDLTLGFWPPGQDPAASDCTVQARFKGQKRIPSLEGIDNDYRARFHYLNGCAEEAKDQDVTDQGALRLVAQDDGSIQLFDPVNVVLLRNDGGELSADIGSAEEGYVGSYRGSLSPPLISYRAEYTLFDENGQAACTFVEEVTEGHGRYVFE